MSMSWEDAWRQVADKVRLGLLRKGVPPDLIDDALQDAALQAWRRSERFERFEDLLRWATKVAWNVVTAEFRRRQRAQTTVVPDVADVVDPARIVEGRLQLEAVIDKLATLTSRDRDAVLSGLVDSRSADPKELDRVKMRRYRGRQKLLQIPAWADPDPNLGR